MAEVWHDRIQRLLEWEKANGITRKLKRRKETLAINNRYNKRNTTHTYHRYKDKHKTYKQVYETSLYAARQLQCYINLKGKTFLESYNFEVDFNNFINLNLNLTIPAKI